ncbi:MAG: glycosyltransferase family 4 protein [Anaerolineae bacterium]|nr:MAG: glycosyltransferase family 4 protein [Anaerolineae bacterium]
MNIVVAVHHFPPRYTSGAELRAYRTAAWLRDHSHDVHVVCVEAIDAGDGHDLTFEDQPYDGLPVRRLSFNLAATPDPFQWAYDNPWIGEHLREYLAQLEPDLLHLIGGYLMSGSTLRVAGNLGIGTVITLTDFWPLCPRITLLRSNGRLCAPPFDAVTCARCLGEERRRYRIPGRIAPALMDTFWRMRHGRIAQIEARMAFVRETLNRVDTIISPSQFLGKLFIKAGVAPGRIVFSRQGRDFPNLTPKVLTKSPAAHLRIGYMGQIAPHKGVHTLFEAVRHLPGAALEVRAYGDVGRFPGYTRHLRHIACQDLRLNLAGVYDRMEVSRILQGLDVIVVPSVWYENSPNTILEAFSHRTPVVASDLGGMAELVRDGKNGLLFTPGNAESLARQLQRLVDDPHLLPTLRAGIGPVKSVTQEMDELEEIYRLVVGNEPSQAAESSQ